MELFKVKGKFLEVVSEPGKNGGDFHTLLIEIDNSYEKAGVKTEKLTQVPFSIRGKTVEICNSVKYNQDIEVSFELDGRNYTNPTTQKTKHYTTLRGIFVYPGKEEATDDLPM